MINTKRLLQLAKKWRKAAALGRRRTTSTTSDEKCSTYSVARKGHLFVYPADGKRFMIPIEYLSSSIFKGLLRMSEEEFGLPSSGPITLPCDSSCMECIISPSPFRVSMDVERAVLNTIAISQCGVSSLPSSRQEQQNLLLCGF